MHTLYKKWFYPLIMPALILFAFVIIIPFIIGIFYSLTAWRGTYFVGGGSPFSAFVGIKNYIEAFQSERFINAFIYTVKYTIIAVIFINVVALSYALLINRISKSTIFRSIFFMPNLLGGLTLGFIWQFIYEVFFSTILFSENGILSIEFLRYMTQDPTKALFALVIMNTWQVAGYMMIIYITGLNTIPSDVYEAASIDGAVGIKKFFRITVPMLMSSFTIVFFLTLANSFKILDQNIALTDGDFGTRMLALQILMTTKDVSPPNYGVAQAQGVIFFIAIAFITIMQVRTTKKHEVEM